MKLTPLALSVILVVGSALVAGADPLPPRSDDYAGNYRTLVNDQKAPVAVATCLASAYDYVNKSPKYDRLGFTSDVIAAAETDKAPTKFSVKDPRTVSAVILVQGEARARSGGTQWNGIVVRCGFVNGKLAAIEINEK